MDNRPDITGVVLAGGQGRRMGGVDKGLVELDGRPMVGYVLTAILPQVSRIMINANRRIDDYEALGYPVITDRIAGSAGPLAGFHAALMAASTPLVLIVPCDTPALPKDLVDRLLTTLVDSNADIAYASDHEHAHPTVVLLRPELVDDLEQWLNDGGRKIDQWYARHSNVACRFDHARAFVNINTPNDRDTFGR